MKKVISLLFAAIVGTAAIMGQSNYLPVKGYVVDKNGNPIPGAEVMAPGGGESAITDVDGSFSMSVPPLLKKLTASYDGMTSKSLKVTSEKDMIFRLNRALKHSGFLNIVLTGGISQEWGQNGHIEYRGGIGLMAGMLGKWGFYGKGTCEGGAEMLFSATAGVIKSIHKDKTFIYFGGGYGSGFQRDYDENISDYTDSYSLPGAAIDLGVIFKTSKHFNLSVGFSYQSNFALSGFNSYNLQLGAGYVF